MGREELSLADLGFSPARHFGLTVVAAGVVTSNNGAVTAHGVQASRASLAAVVKWGARTGHITRLRGGAVVLTEPGRWLLDEFNRRKGEQPLSLGTCR